MYFSSQNVFSKMAVAINQVASLNKEYQKNLVLKLDYKDVKLIPSSKNRNTIIMGMHELISRNEEELKEKIKYQYLEFLNRE
jgi:cell division GTPase FtsZ